MYYVYAVKDQGKPNIITKMTEDNAQSVMINRSKIVMARALKRQLTQAGRLTSGDFCTVAHDESHSHALQYWDDMSGNN